MLEDARRLEVSSTMPSKVYVYEYKAKQERSAAARSTSNPFEAMRRFDDGSWRSFRIKADAPVGFDKRPAKILEINLPAGRLGKLICLVRSGGGVCIRVENVSRNARSYCTSAGDRRLNVPSPRKLRFSTITVVAFPSAPMVKVTPVPPTAFSPSVS
jgi:hypothetical protein